MLAPSCQYFFKKITRQTGQYHLPSQSAPKPPNVFRKKNANSKGFISGDAPLTIPSGSALNHADAPSRPEKKLKKSLECFPQSAKVCVLLIFEQVGYPSGQRMRTVNPSSYAVRGFDPHPHHSKDETARTRRFFLSLETRPAPKNCHLFAKLQTFICRRAHLPGTNASLLKNIPKSFAAAFWPPIFSAY